VIATPGATKLDRLGPEDVQILKREAGVIRGHTCKLLLLEPAAGRPLPTLAQLREHIAARLGAAPRLRQRLVLTPLRVARPVWLDDPQFDVARHVTRIETTTPVSPDELELIVGRVMTQQLDRTHPLWHLDVIEQLDDGSMALIWRLHHCLADGNTTIRLGASVLWSEQPDPPPPELRAWTPAAVPGRMRLLALGLAARAQRSRRDRQLKPSRRSGLHDSRQIVRRELSRGARVTRLGHRIGDGRSVAFAHAPLEDCRRAGKAIDPSVTLNDVVLAIVAGGMRRWLDHVDGPRQGIRVKVPVSLHHGDDTLGNHDSFFLVDLPVAEPDPAGRVLAINRETRERKLDHDAETLYRLGMHPLVAHWAMSARVFTFNVSNVRGPASDIYILGAKVRGMYSLAEIAEHHALRVAIVSTGGSLFFGVCADRDSVADLHVFADGLRRSTDELLALVGPA